MLALLLFTHYECYGKENILIVDFFDIWREAYPRNQLPARKTRVKSKRRGQKKTPKIQPKVFKEE